MALPQALFDAIANPAVFEYTLPANQRYSITAGGELLFDRSDFTLYGNGCVIVPDDSVTLPVVIRGGITGQAASPSAVKRLGSGQVYAHTNQLTLSNVSGIQVGDQHLIRPGVQIYDAQESPYLCFRQVANIAGSVVTYDQPFGYDVPVYGSYEEMIALGADQQKLGDWSTTQTASGHYPRGLGLSHDVFTFDTPNRRPYSNVIVENLAVEWSPTSLAYGTWSFSILYARSSEFRCIRVVNPTGNCLHGFWAGESGVVGLSITGIGRSEPFGPGSTTYPAVAFSLWGGQACYARRILSKASNIQFLTFESGSTETLVADSLISTGAMSVAAQHFAVFATHHKCLVHNVCIDTPTASSTVIPSTIADIELRNIHFLRSEFPDYLPMVLNWTGHMMVGNKTFGPKRKIDMAMTATSDGYLVPRPNGLYRSASIALESRDHVRSITGPGEIFTTNPGARELSLAGNDQMENNATRNGAKLLRQLRPRPTVDRWHTRPVPIQSGVSPGVMSDKLRERVTIRNAAIDTQIVAMTNLIQQHAAEAAKLQAAMDQLAQEKTENMEALSDA